MRTLTIGKEKGQFMCSVSSLMMGDIGEVSQCIRLETFTIEFVDDGAGNKVAVATTGMGGTDNTSPVKQQHKKQQNFAIPQFQFHYDGNFFRQGFIGEQLSGNETLNKNLKFLRRKKKMQS